MRDLSNAVGLLAMEITDGNGEGKLSTMRHLIEPWLAGLNSPEITSLPLSRLIRDKIARLQERIATDDLSSIAQGEALLKDLHNDIIADLSRAYFLVIQPDKRWLYEQRQPVFGDEVADQFSDAGYDIAAAARCIALDEWTASVFHLMRVLEHGLRWLANDIGVIIESGIELENWKNVIDMIEKQIREIEKEPKSEAKSEKARFYSEAASQLRYFKDAWRNHVSHARAKYDEREARDIYNHVGPFMRALASRSGA